MDFTRKPKESVRKLAERIRDQELEQQENDLQLGFPEFDQENETPEQYSQRIQDWKNANSIKQQDYDYSKQAYEYEKGQGAAPSLDDRLRWNTIRSLLRLKDKK